MRIIGVLVVVWLLIGVLASWQRGYFAGEKDPTCPQASTIAVTVVAGPLNYVGVNPKVEECDVPQPSR